MPLILCLESSSEVCSVCISRDGQVLSLIETSEPFSHTRKMTLYIKECLEQAQVDLKEIDALAISDGPGSYTGLRVAAATAKGLCFGLKIPLVAINTLKAIVWKAKQSFEGACFIPMIDARRMEVYTAVFDSKLKQIVETHNLILDDQAFSDYDNTNTILCGTGVAKAEDLFADKHFERLPFSLSSSYLPELAEQAYTSKNFQDLASYAPNYFKAPRVTKSKKPLF